MQPDMLWKDTQTEKATNMESIRDMCWDIADHYGYPAQSNLLVEECAELIQAVNKYRRAKNSAEMFKTFQNYIEEIADVELMLEQVKHLLGISETEIDQVKHFKVRRTLDRIEAEKNDWQELTVEGT